MDNTFYAVQFVINDRSGTLPSIFPSKAEAIKYIAMLDKMRKSEDVKTEIHLYEVTEIKY